MSSEIQKLNDYQHARLRLEMYLSSRDPHTQSVLTYGEDGPTPREFTWVPAVFTAFREIFDNALDEVAAHGHGTEIHVTYNPKTMVVSVKDNGRGIPISYDKKHKQYAATMAVSETKAGRNFGERGATRGLNGVGAAIVNFTSEYFTVDINRDGQHFNQRFQEGENDLVIEPPIILPTRSKATGTHIEFRLSSKVYKSLVLPIEFVRDRMQEAAFCYPKIRFYFNGTQVKTKGVEKDLFAKRKPITFLIEQDGFRSEFWLVPGFFADGAEYTHSLVNAIPMFNGGTHIDAFKRNFFSGMIDAMAPTSKRKKLTPNRSDLADGMLIFNITAMDAPEFDSQSKTRIINEHVGKLVNAAMADADFFKGVIRRNPEWIEAVYERCAERTMKKESADVSKLAKRAGKVRVAKLQDATAISRGSCSLFLTEGDSAMGGLVEARNPSIHGVMPLKGKVMNVHGLSPKQIYENDELARMMNAIGLVPGKRANRHTLRYGRVYITCDADEDGKSIGALLTNFFYLNWPELFDSANPIIHVFETPLIIAAKGKDRKYWYADDVEKFDNDKYRGWEITRAKGLAQLKEVDWKFALAHPKSFPLIDDGELAESLSLLFDSKRADDRKAFIGM